MIQALDRLPGERKQNLVMEAQRAFAIKVQGQIEPGCFSQCQIVTKTHIYLVTRAGVVKFSSKRAGR